MTGPSVTLDLEGPAAPPRSNGELVFAEPWESRVFGMAVSMEQAGSFEWPDFQAELVAAIARWESTHDADDPGETFSYYTCLLDHLGLVADDQLQARLADQRTRPAGHDHDHNHDHASASG